MSAAATVNSGRRAISLDAVKLGFSTIKAFVRAGIHALRFALCASGCSTFAARLPPAAPLDSKSRLAQPVRDSSSRRAEYQARPKVNLPSPSNIKKPTRRKEAVPQLAGPNRPWAGPSSSMRRRDNLGWNTAACQGQYTRLFNCPAACHFDERFLRGEISRALRQTRFLTAQERPFEMTSRVKRLLKSRGQYISTT